MSKPSSWLLIAGLGVAAAGCHKAAQVTQARPQTDSVTQASADPPKEVRMAIQLIAAQPPASAAPANVAPPAPRVVEPAHDLYDQASARPAAADPSPADPPGFRLTVPVCRRAERMDDPLAKTAECAQLIGAAKDQAKACKQAFEDGDDKAALSPACRQAAGFR